jgi:predicted enzyme related to lactoylglutathione lyase
MKDLKWENGDFCWVDLMTTDVTKAKEFYSKIFNWAYQDMETPNGPYTLSNISEGAVGGLSTLPPEMQEQGIPSYWASYVMVESADATVAKAQELGGKIVAPAFDVMDIGRMAAIAGPSGATLCIWEDRDTENESKRTFGMNHGMYGWVELNTHNVDQDGQFFCNLFDWTPNAKPMPEGKTYTEFKSKNSRFPVGGMLQIEKESGDVPSAWTIYFTTHDMAKTTQEIESLGGKMLVPSFEVPGVGLMAVAQDPTGAVFSLSEWRLPESTDC